MGTKANEISCIREAGDYQAGERSHLPTKQTLDRLGIARPTFYRWYDLYQRFGEDALEDKRPGPRRAWNRIPDEIHAQILEMALERSELSLRASLP